MHTKTCRETTKIKEIRFHNVNTVRKSNEGGKGKF
jgi:hypothetical protein